MKIKINNNEYKAQLGETILDVCKREGIRIPRLCAHEGLPHEAVCRLCLVEVNKTDKLVTSCTFRVCEGLEVVTESEKIKKARDINMELLWTDHAGKCATCKKNRRCELQNLAEEYKIDNFHFVPRKGEITQKEEMDLVKDNWSRVVVDEKNPAIARTTELCVECRRCINVCPTQEFSFNHRSGDVVVGTPYEKPLDCIFCGQCAKHCPTGAITDQNDLEKIIFHLDDLKKMAVAIVDPAILGSLQYEFNEINTEDKLIGLLRSVGFERVFDLSGGMEKYISLLKENIHKDKIIFSNYCPSFNLYVEKYYPGLKKYLAKVDIPDELLAKVIKEEWAKKEKINPEDLVVISISSCVGKKAIKHQNLDYVLTVRELGRIARKKQIKENEIKLGDFDKYLTAGFKDSQKMIYSGGLLELMKKRGVKGIAVNGVEQIDKVLDDISKRKEKYDFVEGTVCPGGCVNGGGNQIKIKD